MKMTFKDKLEDLKNNVGNRNGMLMPIVLTGLNEGLSPSEIADLFSGCDTGDPPLSAAEIERAISRAKEYACGDSGTTEARFKVKMRQIGAIREGTSPEDRNFVKRMIEVGEDALGDDKTTEAAQKLLVSLAPHDFKHSKFGGSRGKRAEMARIFLKAVYGDGGFIFATSNIREPRDKAHIFTAETLIDNIDAEGFVPEAIEYYAHAYKLPSDQRPFPIPTHIGTNFYTGESATINKKQSYANKATLAHRTHILVEFDLMEMREQCLFWYGAIKSDSLPVITLVHSGGKSIHGLLKVDEMKRGDNLFGGVSEKAKEEQWDRNVKKVWAKCCSSDNVEYRCDAACKDATRMTRFPGGLRDGHNPQTLLYWRAS